jgi:hypothetical protein
LHTLTNIQLISQLENNKKLNGIPPGDPAEYVERGQAVWIEDVAANDQVAWQQNVGDTRAEFYAAAAHTRR